MGRKLPTSYPNIEEGEENERKTLRNMDRWTDKEVVKWVMQELGSGVWLGREAQVTGKQVS